MTWIRKLVVNIQNYLGNKANGLKLKGSINVRKRTKRIQCSLILFVGNPVFTAVTKLQFSLLMSALRTKSVS